MIVGRSGSVTRVNMKNATLALGAALVLTVAGCSSDSDSDSGTTEATGTAAAGTTDTGSTATSCPTAPAKDDAKPQWTLKGATGGVEMVAATATEAPKITVQSPFSVDQTVVETLVEGDGPVVAETASVTVCYVGVNGRNGNEFDSAYQREVPQPTSRSTAWSPASARQSPDRRSAPRSASR
ncbi:hypothetical protein GOAMI_51_00260 [Gordonia amicalis NBRC 100051 = JCM 11271]|nr:hypothetical protein GOAMI_51_00260 [Gordonia amicalis NBRC 100051 = JCM 11271]